jgi:hypothetical protein
MQRPARAPGDSNSLDEGTDTWDSIEWLLKHVRNHNGRVGMLGVSYDGWTTIMGAMEPHPALKAISPQASPADMWLGDDFHHRHIRLLPRRSPGAILRPLPEGQGAARFPRGPHLRDRYQRVAPLGRLASQNADRGESASVWT